MVEPSNCISAFYDILSSIFQTGKARNIRRSKLRQSLDILQQNSPILSKFETLNKQRNLNQSPLAQCDSAVQKIELALLALIFLWKTQREFAKCTHISRILSKYDSASLSQSNITGTMLAVTNLIRLCRSLDSTNRIWFLIPNPAFL